MNDREGFIQGLREVADFYEQHPEVPLDRISGGTFAINIYTDKDGLREAAKAPGRAEKSAFGGVFQVERTFSAIRVQWWADREQVCRKVVKGTEHVEERVIPAHDKEIVEWECDDSLLRPTDA